MRAMCGSLEFALHKRFVDYHLCRDLCQVAGTVIPFTLIVILPTNKQLLKPALDKQSAQMGQLLARWGRLHTVRSMLSALALLLFLYLAVFTKSSGNPVPQNF